MMTDIKIQCLHTNSLGESGSLAIEALLDGYDLSNESARVATKKDIGGLRNEKLGPRKQKEGGQMNNQILLHPTS